MDFVENLGMTHIVWAGGGWKGGGGSCYLRHYDELHTVINM